jgi:hypothetical protein
MTTKPTTLQSDSSLYPKAHIQKNFLTMQKKLLTISITSEFAIRNISNPHVRSSIVEDLYFQIQSLSELISNDGYQTF